MLFFVHWIFLEVYSFLKGNSGAIVLRESSGDTDITGRSGGKGAVVRMYFMREEQIKRKVEFKKKQMNNYECNSILSLD